MARRSARPFAPGLALLGVLLLVGGLPPSALTPHPTTPVAQPDLGSVAPGFGLVPRHPLPYAPPLTSRLTVNPHLFYNSEPAPMGITDFGLDKSGNAYAYGTDAFYGDVSLRNLTVNEPSNSPATELTIQLNVVVTFTQGGVSYAFWIQDVAFLDTSTNYVTFINNIWNFSASGAGMDTSSVSGNGSVYGSQFYEDGAFTAGNGIDLTYPAHIELLAISGTSGGLPDVLFEYRDGGAWEMYDNVTFPFAAGATGTQFTVDGSQYNPAGLFDDAELILGGPGGGTQTAAVSSDTTLSLEYYNGHNFQSVRNAYDFGSDTAEGISGVTVSKLTSPVDGSLGLHVTAGNGSLGPSFDHAYSALVNLSSPVPSGNVSIDGGRPIAFTGSEANLTIAPGKYSFDLLNATGRLGETNATITAGGYTALSLNLGTLRTLQFVETGLTVGHAWTVDLAGIVLAGRTTTIRYYSIDDNYTYSIPAIPGFRTNESTGTAVVAGGTTTVNITFVAVVYKITIFETGLPSSTLWTVEVNGANYSTINGAVIFSLPNGTFAYRLAIVPGWTALTQASGHWAVNGVGFTKLITFRPFTYQVFAIATGLPFGTAWSLVVAGNWTNGSVSTLLTRTPNGTFGFTIHPSAGWQATPTQGTVSVYGADQQINVSFLPFSFPVRFSETGLSAGTSWSITLSPTDTLSSNGSSILFERPNGSYTYAVAAVAGYRIVLPATGGGSVAVLGGQVGVAVQFAVVPVVDGYVVGTVSPPGSTVSIDGSAITYTGSAFNATLTPGHHSLRVAHPGFVSYQTTFTVVSGQRTTLLPIVLSANPSSPNGVGNVGIKTTASPSSPIWYELGALAAVLVVAGVLGVWVHRRSGSRDGPREESPVESAPVEASVPAENEYLEN